MHTTRPGRITIEKIGDDLYHVAEFDEVAVIDEEVDGSQLMGMLKGKTLVVITPGTVLASVSEHKKGYRLTVAYTCLHSEA